MFQDYQCPSRTCKTTERYLKTIEHLENEIALLESKIMRRDKEVESLQKLAGRYLEMYLKIQSFCDDLKSTTANTCRV